MSNNAMCLELENIIFTNQIMTVTKEFDFFEHQNIFFFLG